jgi:hypothetical protein
MSTKSKDFHKLSNKTTKAQNGAPNTQNQTINLVQSLKKGNDLEIKETIKKIGGIILSEFNEFPVLLLILLP